MSITNLTHRLEVYRERQYRNPEHSEYYQKEIDDMEAEIASLELIDEIMNPKVWEVRTNSRQTKIDLDKDPDVEVVSCERKWSWKHFGMIWVIKFIMI